MSLVIFDLRHRTTNKGVAVHGTASLDTVELWLYTEPSGCAHILLHRRMNARRLASRLGAWLHGAKSMHDTFTCPRNPETRIVLTFAQDKEGVLEPCIYANVTAEGMGSNRLLDRERGEKLFCWLTEWLDRPDTAHSRPVGSHRSEEEYQEYEYGFRRSCEGDHDDGTTDEG